MHFVGILYFRRRPISGKLLRGLCYSICEETDDYQKVSEIFADICSSLEKFDKTWVSYENLYVFELMLIERDARRFITQAIALEKELTSQEVRERAKGKIVMDCPEFNKNRKGLVEVLNQINAVANSEGKGRDDLEVGIL